MAKTIFISYARDDYATANRVRDDLQRRGHHVWLDTHSLHGGEDWKRSIRRAIRQSSLIVVLISSRSVNKRGFYQAEIRYALEVHKEIPPGQLFLIPVRLDDVEPVHDELNDLNWIDLFPSYIASFPKLVAAIEQDNIQQSGAIVSLSPNTARLHTHPFRKGYARRLFASGKVEEALAAYNQLINLDPKAYALYLARAKALHRLGKHAEAVMDLNQAEDLSPGNPIVETTRQELFNNWPVARSAFAGHKAALTRAVTPGHERLVEGDIERARHHYESAKQIGLSPSTYGICQSMIGILLGDANQTTQALNSFDHTVLGPHAKVHVEAINAFISVLEGNQPSLNTLIAMRRELAAYDFYRSPLTYLRVALLNRRMMTPGMEKIFDILRYGE